MDDAALGRLLRVLDTLGKIARAMHPRRLDALIKKLDALDLAFPGGEGLMAAAAGSAVEACSGLRAAPAAENPMIQVYRAMRSYSRALEALAGLAETVPAV